MTHQSLILLDVDGVLLHPVGYKEAMRASLDHFARQMGLSESVSPAFDDIAVFESYSVTNEWDSLAMCAALLLLAALESAPHLARGTVHETLAALRESDVQVATPDYTSLVRDAARRSTGPRPSRFALDILLDRAPQATHDLLRELLADAYQLAAPTTRIFQHHSLGNQRFAETYGHSPDFETESFLATMDRPLLDASTRERLLAAVQESQHYAVIYTARPSLLPVDAPADTEIEALDIVPEAEIAQELVGLNDLPLIATGRLAWLASRNGARTEEYIKPSPMHALAAIGAALSRTEAPSLEAALALVEHGEVTGPLTRLEGRSTRVHVFEDSTGGIHAVAGAVERLRGAGLDVTMEAVGVSPEQVKKDALAKVAHRVVDNVNEGLKTLLN